MQPWHSTEEARKILASCAHRAPAIIYCDQAFAQTRDEWRCYDPADERVQKLAQIAEQHFLAAEREGGRIAALIAIGCSVDEAIDAVQAEPQIINPNDRDQLALRMMVRAQIMGAQLERAA